jgi:protein involved in polysaccharide export with SLBB domain
MSQMISSYFFSLSLVVLMTSCVSSGNQVPTPKATASSSTALAQPNTSDSPSEDSQVEARQDGLGPGDVFEVAVYDQKDLSGTYRLSDTGTINFPLIGVIKLGRSGADDIAAHLADKLRAYIVNPQVRVFVKEFKSKKLFVFGEVKKPGTYQYENGMNIIELISLAGGFTGLANENGTYVTRVVDGNERKIVIPVKDIVEGNRKDVPLVPGDIINIPESIF